MNNFVIVNGDTDSISIRKPDQTAFTKEEQDKLLLQLNSLMDEGIKWTNDGMFPFVGVIAAKNYILFDGKKIKIKGSGLKATKKEPRLKQFIKDVIQCIVEDRIEEIQTLYFDVAKEILVIDEKSDINKWAFKATATKKVIDPTTSFNQKVHNALIDARIDIVEGDKYYLFFKKVSGVVESEYIIKKGKRVGKTAKRRTKIQNLEVVSQYDGDICKDKLLEKLFKTITTFKLVLDITKYPNLAIKKNIKLKTTLLS